MENKALKVPADSKESFQNLRVKVVHRDDIPSLYSAQIKDKTYYLGILKDLRKNIDLDEFIPQSARLAMAWVHLGKDEVLKTHIHPTKSLILVCTGSLRLVGDMQTLVIEGDAILIPPYRTHGLIGAGESGFWGLSIQFEDRGLYENPDEPLAEFVEDQETQMNFDVSHVQKNTLSSLLLQTETYQERFSKNPLFTFLKDNENRAAELIHPFLKYFQVWSNAFQKMLLIRDALCENSKFQSITREHLEEEWGHDKELASDRQDKETFWDPSLSALSSWFSWKMMTLDESEKCTLVHLVVESVATVFYSSIPQGYLSCIKSNHFDHHNKVDADHVKMGMSLLEDLNPSEYENLHKILNEGWDILDKLFERIYQLLNDQKP